MENVPHSSLFTEQITERLMPPVSPSGYQPPARKPITPVAPPSDPTGVFAGLASLIQPFIQASTADIDARIDAAVELAMLGHVKTTRIEIFNPETKETKQIDGQHELFPTMLKLANMRKPVYAWGEAGSGKSTAARNLAKLLELPFYYLALQAQTTESRLMGYCDGNGKFVETDFYRAYSGGGVFLLDELELGSGNLLGSLNGALANGSASFPCGLTKRHPDFICIATGNTPALGATIQYSDRRALEGSVRDRFLFIQWDTDKALEMSASVARFPQATQWVEWVHNVRGLAKDFPKLTCTQRASLEGSDLLAAGFSVQECAEMLVFRGMDSNSKNTILARYSLPKVGR